jgi:hypothetical protein
MTYELKVSQKPTYLHFIVTGPNSVKTILRYAEDIIRECAARKCFRILIEERLEGKRLPLMDVFKLVQDLSATNRGIFQTIAYVDVHAKDDAMQFAETASVNRMMPLAVFATVADAEKWLTEEEQQGTEPQIIADTDTPHP